MNDYKEDLMLIKKAYKFMENADLDEIEKKFVAICKKLGYSENIWAGPYYRVHKDVGEKIELSIYSEGSYLFKFAIRISPYKYIIIDDHDRALIRINDTECSFSLFWLKENIAENKEIYKAIGFI